MKVKQINHINEAILVLRHFIDLSAKLLPFLNDLQRLKNPSIDELRDKNKIILVYENYSFDTNTSLMLLNSNVLDLIKDSFENISKASHFLNPRSNNKILNNFLQEHRRLKDNWFQINAN